MDGEHRSRVVEELGPRMLPTLTPENRAFWTGGAKGELLILRCRSCGLWVHPPRRTCPACDGDELVPEAVSGKGTVFTFTVNRHPYNPAVPLPYVLAIVELVEQENLRFTTNIVDCVPESVEIGMPVRVAFEDHGEIFVPVFEPDRDRLSHVRGRRVALPRSPGACSAAELCRVQGNRVPVRELFHVMHVVDDFDAADGFFTSLFSPEVTMPKSWSDFDKRWASIGLIGPNFALEIMEPSKHEADQGSPIPKFFRRFGEHLHSIALYVDADDLGGVIESLRANGVRVVRPDGSPFGDGGLGDLPRTVFTHGRDTCGQLELQVFPGLHDPRSSPTGGRATTGASSIRSASSGCRT